MNEKRNAGIDLLRVLSMLMIVVFHILYHGGVPWAEEISYKGYLVTLCLQTFCLCAVDAYAIISGYVGVHARWSLSSLALLYLRVWLYSVAATAVIMLVFPGSVDKGAILKALLPVTRDQYWYFTAYFGCYLLSPLINAAFRTMKKQESLVCLLSCFAAYSILPSFFHVNPFQTNTGNSVLWLLLLYALGAYIRVHGWLNGHSLRSVFALLCGASLLCALSGFGIELVTKLFTGKKEGFFWLFRNDSPTLLLPAALAVVLFSRLRILHGRKIIAFLAPLCFSVYLIHDHPLVRTHVISAYMRPLGNLPFALLLPCILLAALAVFVFCIGIDWLRECIFTSLRLKEKLRGLEIRLIRNIGE